MTALDHVVEPLNTFLRERGIHTWHPDELCPRVGFIVSNLARSAEASSPSTISAARASSTSRRARTRSNGLGCHVGPSPLMPFASSSGGAKVSIASAAIGPTPGIVCRRRVEP